MTAWSNILNITTLYHQNHVTLMNDHDIKVEPELSDRRNNGNATQLKQQIIQCENRRK